MKACLPTNQCTVPENTKLLQDPLGAILDHIQRHPQPPTNIIKTNERPNNNIMPYEHKETNNIQNIKGKQREEEGRNIILDNEHKINGENIGRTRYGRIVKNTQAHV